jgi:hypothetical protein
MGRNADLEKLQKRLRAAYATYQTAPKPRTDSIKRLAARQAIDATLKFIGSQPGWHKSDSEMLLRMTVALQNVENGHPVSWLSNKPSHRPPDSINIRVLRARAGAAMELLMRPDQGIHRLGREDAAKKIFKQIPRKSPLFKNTKANWETVARWRAEISISPPGSIERKAYDAFLGKRL